MLEYKELTVVLDEDSFQEPSEFSENSYLGGKPKMPENIIWPRDSDNRPLTFIAQVDLAEVFEKIRNSNFKLPIGSPSSGMLYLFVDTTSENLWEEGTSPVKVIYSECSEYFVEHEFPEGLRSQFEPYSLMSITLSDFNSANVRPPGRYIVGLPKLPISIRAVNIEQVESDSFDSEVSGRTLLRNNLKEKFQNTYYPQMGWTFISDITPLDYRRNKGDWFIPDSYPWFWLCIERTAQYIYTKIVVNSLKVERDRSRGNNVADYDFGIYKYWADVPNEALGWIEKAKGKDFFDLVESDVIEEFQKWIRSLTTRLRGDIYSLKPKSEWSIRHKLFPYLKYDADRGYFDKTIMKILSGTKLEWYLNMRGSTALIGGIKVNEWLTTSFRSIWPYLREQQHKDSIPEDVANIMDYCYWMSPYNERRERFQMFGEAIEVQDLGDIPSENIMLFQIPSSDAFNLMIGDLGVLQIWISPADLAKGNFDNVTYTADCH
jgi:uncharacterized protein YwqG